MNIKKLSLVGLIYSGSVFSGDTGPIQVMPFPVVPVLSLTLGPAFTAAGTSQIRYIQPDVFNDYRAEHRISTMLFGELFAGAQRFINPALIGQFGLAAVGVGNAHLKGEVLFNADPALNNYSYTYKLMHTHLALKGKLIGNLQHQPYLSLSMGLGSNYAFAFNMIPHNPSFAAIPDFTFRSHHSIAITYSAGIGVQRFLTERWQLGLGYEITNWGKSRLNTTAYQTVDTGLTIKHLLASQVQISLVYVM